MFLKIMLSMILAVLISFRIVFKRIVPLKLHSHLYKYVIKHGKYRLSLQLLIHLTRKKQELITVVSTSEASVLYCLLLEKLTFHLSWYLHFLNFFCSQESIRLCQQSVLFAVTFTEITVNFLDLWTGAVYTDIYLSTHLPCRCSA